MKEKLITVLQFIALGAAGAFIGLIFGPAAPSKAHGLDIPL